MELSTWIRVNPCHAEGVLINMKICLHDLSFLNVYWDGAGSWNPSSCSGGEKISWFIWHLSDGLYIDGFVQEVNTAVSPLLMHWRYCSLAPSHRYIPFEFVKSLIRYLGLAIRNVQRVWCFSPTMEGKKLYILNNQCHACWWPGDTWSQVISIHGFDLVKLRYQKTSFVHDHKFFIDGPFILKYCTEYGSHIVMLWLCIISKGLDDWKNY